MVVVIKMSHITMQKVKNKMGIVISLPTITM